MRTSVFEQIHQINYFSAELNALYHQAALKLGLSDSAMQILYAICDHGESCMLGDIYRQTGISKQTVNSALRKLEAENIVYLTQQAGKAKMVCLTEAGKAYAGQTVARLFNMEREAFSTWTEAEIETHLSLLAKYVDSFRQTLAGSEIQPDTRRETSE